MIIKYTLTFMSFFLLTSSFAQESTETFKDRDFRIEIEPAPFLLKGYSIMLGYDITKDNSFSINLYSQAADVPEFAKAGFSGGVGDSTTVRMPFQLAINFRYKINAFKKWESNPVIGLITGWEYFNVSQPSDVEPLKISTIMATSYMGFEWYLYKRMLYLNPQMRMVVYYGTKKSDETRPERLEAYILPQISLGVKL